MRNQRKDLRAGHEQRRSIALPGTRSVCVAMKVKHSRRSCGVDFINFGLGNRPSQRKHWKVKVAFRSAFLRNGRLSLEETILSRSVSSLVVLCDYSKREAQGAQA